MSKKTVAVIFGGLSPEYDVSLKSSYSIISAIDRDKYDIILLGITRQGGWYRYYGSVEGIPLDRWHIDESLLHSAIISPSRSGAATVSSGGCDAAASGGGDIEASGSGAATSSSGDGDAASSGGGGLIEFQDGQAVFVHIDAVFPVLHGRNGEDGTVQGLCELAGIPVVGSGSAASALCMDKDRSHKLVSLVGIAVPDSVCFEYSPTDDEVVQAMKRLGLPLFVKPVKAGSSFGITMVEGESQLLSAVRTALEFDDAVILEEYIDGFETGCSVVGNGELITGRVDEIELAHGFFDYEEKYTLKTSKIHMPARIDDDMERRLQEAAKLIYRTLGCSGYARIDIFLSSAGKIVFNEANTIPGFTSHSRFPNMMKGVGIEYPQLVEMLIELAVSG